MKQIKLLVLPFVLLVMSCNNDDDATAPIALNPTAGPTVNGVGFSINDAKEVDNYHFYSDVHSEYEFVLSDAEITVTASPGAIFGYTADGSRISIDVSMYSAGNTFQTGVYPFNENFGITPTTSFFDGCTIYLDPDHDGNIDDYISATGGTITVSGNPSFYILDFDVMLSNGETLDYTYIGGFDHINNRLE